METAARKTCLVITRHEGESVWIGDVRVTRDKKDRLVIEAPEDVRVIREELMNRPKKSA